LPEASAVVVLLATPVSVTTASDPLGLTVPEMLKVVGGARDSVLVLATLPAVAVMVAVCEVVTETTVALNVADVAPPGMVTLAGTVTLALLLERVTKDPPDTAATESVAVQVDAPDDVKLDGEQESALIVGRF